MKYEVIIYWSAEDKAFVAEVPELPGCAAGLKLLQEPHVVFVEEADVVDAAAEHGGF